MSDKDKKTDVHRSLDGLVGCDKPEFIKNFQSICEGITVDEIASIVWGYGNERWSKGYNQGKYNPDFD